MTHFIWQSYKKILKIQQKILIFIVNTYRFYNFAENFANFMNRFDRTDDMRRDELIRTIERSVESITIEQLEALYYDMVAKGYIEKL